MTIDTNIGIVPRNKKKSTRIDTKLCIYQENKSRTIDRNIGIFFFEKIGIEPTKKNQQQLAQT